MKILIAGSRTLTEPSYIGHLIDQAFAALPTPSVNAVIHGGAKGVDLIAHDWAKKHGIPVEVYAADWGRFGKAAGHRRNVVMVDRCDAAVVIWDGQSKGTRHTIELLTASGKPFVVVSTGGRAEE